MISALSLSALALSALAHAPASQAAPVASSPVQRRDAGACTSLGKGPLGFNSSSIGIYNPSPPADYLTFDGGDDHLHAIPSSTPDVPEFFELFSCKVDEPLYPGKGSISVYQGYIQASDGRCIAQVDAKDGSGGYFTKEECNYALDGAKQDQHFEFALDSFFPYYSVVYLGLEKGPSPNANNSFGSGGHYKLGLSSDKHVTADYQEDEQTSSDRNVAMIAQLGGQYVTPDPYFPTCTLYKTGSLSLVDDKGTAQPVTPSNNTYNARGDWVLVLNGTQSDDGFEFYECDSAYMGYTNDDTNHYGHLKTKRERFSDDCFERREINQLATDTIYSSPSGRGGCFSNDSPEQLSSFFHFDSQSGSLTFLGARAQRFPSDVQYGWTVKQVVNEPDYDATEIFLTNKTSPYTLRYD